MIIAHYGGIDEFAIFVVPVVLALLLLRWADKRARARPGMEEEEPSAARVEEPDHRA